jgi:hypothetical protein
MTAHSCDGEVKPEVVRLRNTKELKFHSRSNIEKLAELSLTIEEELKQKAFAEGIGAVYAAQDAFQSKILKLIERQSAEQAQRSQRAQRKRREILTARRIALFIGSPAM